jgi:sugar phosphate isomerase/epimerase
MPIPTYWGMAGVFPGELELWRGDGWANQRRFVAAEGFSGGSVGVADLVDPARRELLAGLAQSHGQVQAVHLGVQYQMEPSAAHRHLAGDVTKLLEARGDVPLAYVAIVTQGLSHRFDREIPLALQMERLSAQLSPVVERCRAEGLPVVIENHADYYLSDLVELCERTPGLGIQLDTGNCFLIGERPDLIPDAAFPLIQSTHWKDVYVRPNEKTLHFELTGATLGAGHAGLETIFARLIALHPDPATIRMMIEWVPDPARDVKECLANSKRHLTKISRGQFPVRKPETGV